jgi:hypothetical protein
MPSTRKTLEIALTAVILLAGAPCALGQTAPEQAQMSAVTQTPQMPAGGQKARFELSAMYTAIPSLSHGEIEPNAQNAMVAGPEPAPTPQIPQMPAQDKKGKISKAPLVPGLDASSKLADPPIDNSYLSEYNVDWSHWISTHADRWYYTLKASEEMLGLHFVTLRPAMIKYTCYADGSIGNLVLKQSSGVPVYDRLQMETLVATMPTMPFPRGTHRTSITLCQGWESHPRQPGESDFQLGSFGKNFPKERVSQWSAAR